ncbi:MAG TPA: nucleoside-diphosphate kinase [Rubricoccaceae bacterium]|nr:nucleoside-diphosphate kinase [Rubricoccaceae bacterium]
MERTLAIIKPDAFAAGHAGKIIDRILAEGFAIRAMKLVQLTRAEAEGFYAVHRERPFFGELTAFMSSAPCVPLVLEREDAVAKWREVIGATNPAEAAEGTIRKLFARSVGENAVHGSASPENGVKESRYFFPESELVANGGTVIDA